jgi:hypothetical protein
MKHVIYGVISIVTVVLTLVLMAAVAGRHTREQEMQVALRQAVEESVDQVMMQGKYTLHSKEELVADFTSLLVGRLRTKDPNLHLKVDIAGVDEVRGLLSVHVTEEFTHPNGRIGTTEASATVVFEQEEKRDLFRVDYIVPKSICLEAQGDNVYIPEEYKSYLFEEGDRIKAPVNPPNYGAKHFAAWADEDGATYTAAALQSMQAEKSLTLTAVYN